jgi:hypothetical protein
MKIAIWAEHTARAILQEPHPPRWAPTRGGAPPGRTLNSLLGPDADLLTAAAWLHDIGYAPALNRCGFHPLDGARYLRDAQQALPQLCSLVAHHTRAITEADERGLAGELSSEFAPARADLTDALIYCDMTAGPDGQPLPVQHRLAEIRSRYGPDDLVTRAISRSAPELTAAVHRVTRALASQAAPPAAARVLAAAGTR